MSIQVSKVTKLFGKQKALDEVSFSVGSGGVTGFLGPNGAGKSTLMKILSCFIPPTSGDASVCGFNVLENSIEVRKRVGYLPENNPLYTEMYVREYLMFIAGIHRLGSNSDLRVREMIELTGLGPEQGKKIQELSKGYRQRVGLAQVLIHDPEVLILDEPTSGLDPNQLVGIRNLIREIGEKKTVMLSTHIMQEVEAVCDRVIIIDKGKIVIDDATSALAQFNLGKQVISVEFSSAASEKELASIEGVSRVIKINDTHWHLEAPPETDIRPALFQFAVNHNLTVLSLQKEERKLEEVFQQLTHS